MPIAAQPESILYFYLTTPRVATPRWYLEGSAVFFDTWMAGGIGRAQSPWDEMVFRSMVRDGSRFYDPLGLVSEGVKVDFQVQVQSYLYGGRFMSYLAFSHSPEQVARWVERKDGSKAYYASQFREVFGVSLEQAWRDWVAWEREFQQKNLETIREHPTTPARDIGTRALGSVSRAHLEPRRPPAVRRLQLPRHRRPRGRPLPRRRGDSKARGHQGPLDLHRDLARPRPGDRHPLLHDRQQRLPRHRAARAGHREVPDAPEGRADRRARLQPGRPVDLGHPPPERHLHPRPHPLPVDRVEARALLAVRGHPLRHRPVAGREAPLRLGGRDHRPEHPPRLRDGAPGEGRRDAAGRAGVRRVHPLELRLLRRRPLPLRELVLHGRLERLPLRARHEGPRGGDERGDGPLPPAAPRRGPPRRLPVHRRGVRPRRDRGAPARGRERGDAPRPADRGEAPRGARVEGRLPRRHPPRLARRPAGTTITRGGP